MPAVYYNECAFCLPGAIACLQAIQLDMLADVLQEYQDSLEANPYLGPPDIWPEEYPPVGSQSESDVERIDKLDERWLTTVRAIGESAIWSRLAQYVRESASGA